MYIEGKYISGMDDLSEVYEIRRQVFHSVELATENFFETDCSMICDQLAVHALTRVDGKVVGCGTLFYDGSVFLLDGVAVPEEERGQKYGDFIVRMLIDRAFQRGAKEVILYCETGLEKFFGSIGFHRKKESGGILLMALLHTDICRECGSKQ